MTCDQHVYVGVLLFIAMLGLPIVGGGIGMVAIDERSRRVGIVAAVVMGLGIACGVGLFFLFGTDPCS